MNLLQPKFLKYKKVRKSKLTRLDLKSTKIELINKNAKLAQQMAFKQIKKRQQILAIKNSAKVAQTKSKKKYFYRNAAKNLVQYTIGRNQVSEASTIKDDLLRDRNNL